MNKVIAVLLGIVVISVGYIAYKHRNTDTIVSTFPPVSTSETAEVDSRNTRNADIAITGKGTPVKQATPNQTPSSNWKVFANKNISVTAPSSFASNTEALWTSSTSLIISTPDIVSGLLQISVFPDKASYDELFSEAKIAEEGDKIRLINSNYLINNTNGRMYQADDEFDSVYILVPSKFTVIMIVPNTKLWKGYTEVEVNKIIQSIRF